MYSFLINTAALKELAAIKGEEHYDFFTYKGKKPVEITRRGQTVEVKKGMKFGVRQSVNKKDIRLIFPGEPNKVFTLTLKQAQDLAKGV